MKRMSFSASDWVIEDTIGDTKNVSARIVELLIKGRLYEKGVSLKQNKNALSSILSNNRAPHLVSAITAVFIFTLFIV